MTRTKIIFIVGPTAVGKSEVAMRLAQKLNGELVSCDSMQIYKEINIASNKPSKDELEKIPYHLLNVVSIEEEFDVVQFNRLANNAIEEIVNKNKVPIIVGGSGLYMQVLLDGIFEGARQNQELRDKFYAQAEEKGNERLYEELKSKDPKAAEKIHPNNLKRIVRALEVCESQGKLFSELKEERQGLTKTYDTRIFVLNRFRDDLYQRINQRVDEMFDQGALKEIQMLEGKKWSLTAAHLISVKEIHAYLRGDYDLEESKELIKRNTRRFAKRQLTWFRKEKRAHWVEIKPKEDYESVVQYILNEIGAL